jgi:hypothetical protein
MAAAGWVRRTVPNGWVLHRDCDRINVEDVFRVFVFRTDTHLAGREADSELEAVLKNIGARVGESLRVSLETVFRSANKNESPAATK